MLDKFVQRNVAEVDSLIEKARERLAEQEAKLASGTSDAEDIAVRMKQGLARLQVYRSFIEKSELAPLRNQQRFPAFMA
jgi:hypothetical protein